MTTKMTSGERTFREAVIWMADYARACPEQRKGQAYFNAFFQIEPEICDLYRGSAIDPFYRDELIPAFLEEISGWYS